MERHTQRYRARPLAADHPTQAAIRDWFAARLDYLAGEYRDAINAADNIIAGKQWLYDNRPMLTYE